MVLKFRIMNTSTYCFAYEFYSSLFALFKLFHKCILLYIRMFKISVFYNLFICFKKSTLVGSFHQGEKKRM